MSRLTQERDLSWLPVVGFAFVLAAFAGLVSAHDLAKARGLPREHATVVSARDAGVDFRCGRGSSREELHWRSSDPPRGLPAELVSAECSDMVVGDRITVVRVVRDPRADRVEVLEDLPRSWGDVLGMSALLFVGVIVFTVGVRLIGWVASALWRRIRPAWWREAKPRRAPEEGVLHPAVAAFPPALKAERLLDWCERHLRPSVRESAREALNAGDFASVQEQVIAEMVISGARLSVHEVSVVREMVDREALSPTSGAGLSQLLEG